MNINKFKKYIIPCHQKNFFNDFSLLSVKFRKFQFQCPIVWKCQNKECNQNIANMF